jgi:hypothetical protein
MIHNYYASYYLWLIESDSLIPPEQDLQQREGFTQSPPEEVRHRIQAYFNPTRKRAGIVVSMLQAGGRKDAMRNSDP